MKKDDSNLKIIISNYLYQKLMEEKYPNNQFIKLLVNFLTSDEFYFHFLIP